MLSGNCGCTPQQANVMFKEAEQFIDEEITDRTYAMNRYWVDLYPMKPFPDGVGLVLDKLRYFSDIGPQYDGFDGWRKIQRSRTGAMAEACGEHDACGYDWETVGSGMETVSYDLMSRDLKTHPICIKDIRTLYQYRTFQELFFKNLANISANMREQLNRNAVMMFALKHIAIAGLPTAKDPHQLPNINGVEVGKLTYDLALMLYHSLIIEGANQALATMDGMPMVGLVGHPETLRGMYYDDPELRKDIRECRAASGNACDLIKRYAFIDTIGPFVLMPDLYAPRYTLDAAGNFVRVFPFIREVEIQYGTRPIPNPLYQTAPYEGILFLLKDLLTLRTRTPLESVGGMTRFGPEPNMFDWRWWNPPGDPFNRVGQYVTTAEVGVEPGDFTDVPMLIVKRRPEYWGQAFWAAEQTPPEAAEFENALPAEACPCPTIIGAYPDLDPTRLLLIFDRDIALDANDPISLTTSQGTFVDATLISISDDGTRAVVDFGSAEPCKEIGRYVALNCNGATSYCNACVLKTALGGILDEEVTLTLNRLIKADTAAEVVTLILGDGSMLDVALAANADTENLQYTVELTYAQFYDSKGICAVCVPPATDDSCPECDASDLVACEEAS